MSYAIMRFEKRKSNDISGMENHNERKTENHSNYDIDLEKKNLNYDLVPCDSYRKKIDEEIKKRYTGKKAIRKDAVLCTEFLFTSDKEFFSAIGEEKEKIFFEKSLEFLENKFGKENIVSAKVHKDETTPHLHAIIVPLHKDGSLSMKKYIDNKSDLSKLQDEYYSHVSKEFPELDRGKSSTETKAKHLAIDKLKKNTDILDTNYKKFTVEFDKELQEKKEILFKKKKSITHIDDEIKELDSQKKELQEKKNQIIEMKKEILTFEIHDEKNQELLKNTELNNEILKKVEKLRLDQVVKNEVVNITRQLVFQLNKYKNFIADNKLEESFKKHELNNSSALFKRFKLQKSRDKDNSNSR